MNDIADRDFDYLVERTKKRPLTSGKINLNEAVNLLVVFVGLAFILVLFTNLKTVFFAFLGGCITIIYPFMKRFTHLPQAVLGLAFSLPILMGYTAETGSMPPIGAWYFYIGCFFWIMSYDTYYALVDKHDDEKINLKSTAILFGRYARIWILLFNIITLSCFFIAGIKLQLNGFFFVGLAVVIALFTHQIYSTRHLHVNTLFNAFLNNNWVGIVLFTAILASLIK